MLKFSDIEKAFDSISVLEALKCQGVDNLYMESLAKIYKEAKAVAKIGSSSMSLQFPNTGVSANSVLINELNKQARR